MAIYWFITVDLWRMMVHSMFIVVNRCSLFTIVNHWPWSAISSHSNSTHQYSLFRNHLEPVLTIVPFARTINHCPAYGWLHFCRTRPHGQGNETACCSSPYRSHCCFAHGFGGCHGTSGWDRLSLSICRWLCSGHVMTSHGLALASPPMSTSGSHPRVKPGSGSPCVMVVQLRVPHHLHPRTR